MKNEIIKKDNGYVSTIFLNRPEKKNALNADALFNLGHIMRAIDKENIIRVVIIRGSGENIFSSGVDLSGGQKERTRTIEGLGYCLDGLINYSMPIISMINGPAIGAGLDISVISDFRIASTDARFGAPLVKLGRTYYFTAIERLTSLVGLGAAKEMLLTGRLINSQKAKEIGLINQLVTPAELESVAYGLANELAEEAAPLAVKVTKQTIKRLFQENRINPVLGEELHRLVEEINLSKDAEEGIKAKLEKRSPIFSGK